MRYSRVNRRLWGDRWFRSLSDQGQRLWLFLLTCPVGSPIPGLFALSAAAAAEALRLSPELFDAAWAELNSHAYADWAAGLVWLPRAIRHDPPQGPNHVKGWARAWVELPESDLLGPAREGIAAELRSISEGLAELFLNLIPSSTKPSAKPSPDPLPIPTPTPTPTPSKIVERASSVRSDPWGLAPDERPPPSPKARADTSLVKQVFEHWQAVRRHPNAKLDGKRKGKILARLREDFTAEQLCEAIDGVAASPWHCGDNPEGKVYDDLVTVLRDAPQVEKFLDLARKARPAGPPKPIPAPPPPAPLPPPRRLVAVPKPPEAPRVTTLDADARARLLAIKEDEP